MGVAFFLQPGHIATGGTPGMAIVLYFATGLSTGIGIFVINVPLLLAGLKFIDRGFAIRSIITIIATSGFVEILLRFVEFPAITSPLLNALYGGALVGLGVALVLKGQASAGGTTIIAKIVNHFWNIKPAQVILATDLVIITLIGIIFADMEKMLWSMLSIYVTTQVIDRLLSGVVSEKIVHIVTSKPIQVGHAIREKLERDGSIIKGVNLTQDLEKNILFVVVGSRRLPLLKKVVTEEDANALMIVMEASEIQGSSRRPT